MAHPNVDLQDTDASCRVERVHHIYLAVRDLGQARQFWIDVLGAEPLVASRAGFAEVRIGDIVVGLAEADGGWTGSSAEYPHYGFRFAPADMMPIRERVRAFGVPTGEIWTRHRVEGLMYFRDPSGNLLETACWHGLEDADRLPLSKQTGGDYGTDLAALNYTWSERIHPPTDVRTVRPTQLDHLSLPVRDMAETARFWVDVLGAKPGRSPSHMVEIAGIDISFSAAAGGWTECDAEFPRCAFSIGPEDLAPLRERFESFGVPTHDVRTRNGSDASMLFRDPSGNLFELYCEHGSASSVRRTRAAGGNYVPDVRALCYEQWNDPGR